jgi:hypothetical protein
VAKLPTTLFLTSRTEKRRSPVYAVGGAIKWWSKW